MQLGNLAEIYRGPFFLLYTSVNQYTFLSITFSLIYIIHKSGTDEVLLQMKFEGITFIYLICIIDCMYIYKLGNDKHHKRQMFLSNQNNLIGITFSII